MKDKIIAQFRKEYPTHEGWSDQDMAGFYQVTDFFFKERQLELDGLKERVKGMRLPIRIKGRSIFPDKKYLKALDSVISLLDEALK